MSNYFTQKIKVSTIFNTINRFEYFKQICRDKKVLHVGFVDYPITNKNQNMHLMIDSVVEELVGVDPNFEHFEEFKNILINKRMYKTLMEVQSEHFDIVIVPEVIEHVGNMQEFIENLSKLNFNKMYITAPDAFLLSRNVSYDKANSMVTEVVHPDHNCWFSPYTLKNIVLKYSDLKLDEMFYVGGNSIVGVFEK